MSVVATVIVPTHDHGQTLRLALASALDQTVADIEVVVVGDGVPDITREIVDEFRLRYAGTPGIISRKDKNPHLVAVTTTSALGRSSIYNRLTFDRRRDAVRRLGHRRDDRGRRSCRRRRRGSRRRRWGWCAARRQQPAHQANRPETGHAQHLTATQRHRLCFLHHYLTSHALP